MPHISSAEVAVNYIRNVINKNRIDFKKFSWVMLFNEYSDLLGVIELSAMDSDCLKEVYQSVLISNATRFTLLTNAPGGRLGLNQFEHEMLGQIELLDSIFGFKMIDFISFSSEGYISSCEENWSL
ncbi:hypothetical protein [uncultured Psychroserpens sp.]|uniref:hypothetical protein n=1 Tax=uncultured Psychroserpens sp. TaxID=255436 RepID=UPI00262DC62A|nr:hypothetical protein [uncultured Psychroserpens sp.]